MKTYIFELEISEGYDEFWEAIGDKSGCDEVFYIIEDALKSIGFFINNNCKLTLKSYAKT